MFLKDCVETVPAARSARPSRPALRNQWALWPIRATPEQGAPRTQDPGHPGPPAFEIPSIRCIQDPRASGTPASRDPRIRAPRASRTPSIRGPHAGSLAQKQPHPRRKPPPRRPPSASQMVTLRGITPVGASAPRAPNTALCPPLSHTRARGSAEPREKGVPPPPAHWARDRSPWLQTRPAPPSLSFPIRLSAVHAVWRRGLREDCCPPPPPAAPGAPWLGDGRLGPTSNPGHTWFLSGAKSRPRWGRGAPWLGTKNSELIFTLQLRLKCMCAESLTPVLLFWDPTN